MIKNEKNIYKIINIIVFILCNISFIYIVYFNENSNYKYIYILPLIFEICYIFLISKNISYFREFIITFSLIGFIRYVIVPVTITYNGGYNGRSPQMPSEQSFDLAIFLMIYELIVCSICIYFFSRKMKKYRQNGQNIEGITNNTIKGPKSIMIYIIFSLMIISMVIINPNTIRSFSFINPNENALNYDNMSFASQITIMGISIVKQLIYVIVVYQCKKKYDKSNNIIFVIISLVALFINGTIYFGSNRLDFLLMFAASIIYWIIIFKKYVKTIVSICGVLGITILVLISNSRSYSSISKNTSISEDLVDFFQSYTGGPYNVAIAIESAELFEDERNIGVLIFDFLRPTLGINLIMKNLDINYTNVYFNYRMFFNPNRASQIMPMIGEGYFTVGIIFAPIVDIIFIYIAFNLKKIQLRKNRIELIYFFMITMIRLGFLMGQNATIQMNDLSFNLFVPLILYWFNNKFIFKKGKEENVESNA